jgi:hypothetical protein
MEITGASAARYASAARATTPRRGFMRRPEAHCRIGDGDSCGANCLFLRQDLGAGALLD